MSVWFIAALAVPCVIVGVWLIRDVRRYGKELEPAHGKLSKERL